MHIKMNSTLTLKQAKFVKEYLDTGNVTEAADRAYKPKNRNTAHAIGAENLRKPTIMGFIKNTMAENGLNAELVVRSLVEDIKSKPANRINELLLASKLLGLFDSARRDLIDHPTVYIVSPSGAKKYGIKYNFPEN